jgi:hypothetical protein
MGRFVAGLVKALRKRIIGKGYAVVYSASNGALVNQRKFLVGKKASKVVYTLSVGFSTLMLIGKYVSFHIMPNTFSPLAYVPAGNPMVTYRGAGVYECQMKAAHTKKMAPTPSAALRASSWKVVQNSRAAHAEPAITRANPTQ